MERSNERRPSSPVKGYCNGDLIVHHRIINPKKNILYQKGQIGPAKLDLSWEEVCSLDEMPVGIEVDLLCPPEELASYLKQRGICVWGLGKFKNRVYQTCHLVSHNEKYYICHYKELFLLNGKTAKFRVMDIPRRNLIISDFVLSGACKFGKLVSPNWNNFTEYNTRVFVLDTGRNAETFKLNAKVKKIDNPNFTLY